MPRCLIALKQPNGVCEAVRCDADGYPDSVGLILQNFYRKKEKVEELVKLGSLACLAESLKNTLAYERDFNIIQRGAEFRTEESLMLYFSLRSNARFLYVYDMSKEKWYFTDADSYQLTELLPAMYENRIAMPLFAERRSV